MRILIAEPIDVEKISTVHPYVPASKKLPKITLKAFVLGVLLSIIMGAANAYLGLKVGSTVSACIPAAVISMAFLKFFKTSNILENNIVQTTASAGEVIAAAVSFTLPALVLIGYWDNFPPVLIACITLTGGSLGVLLSVPLRRALIVESDLRFPEGVATAEVLQAGEQHREGQSSAPVRKLLLGGVLSSVFTFLQTGLQCVSDGLHYWSFAGSTVYGFGTGFSAAVIGSGYIVGFRAVVSLALGGVLAWCIGVPVFGLIEGLPDAQGAHEAAMHLWSTKVRMVGIGAMSVGGAWLAITLVKPLKVALRASLDAFKKAQQNKGSAPRTERDIPFVHVLACIIGTLIPIFAIIRYLFTAYNMNMGSLSLLSAVGTMTVLILLISFICASISGYMFGILGATSNPLSGIVVISVLVLSTAILLLLGSSIDFSSPHEAMRAAGSVLLFGCAVACASAVSGDNLQDLKTGQLVGSTPWKQQVMLLVGVAASALTIGPVMELLFQAYGIGHVLPRPDMNPFLVLFAPKASLMAALSQSIFQRSMDWTLFFVGIGIGIIVIAIDRTLKHRGSSWSLPVLGVAVGIYMPLDITVPLAIGGLINLMAEGTWAKRDHSKECTAHINTTQEIAHRDTTLLCAGLIAGESLLGVALAIPFVIYKSTDILRYVPPTLEPFGDLLGITVVSYLCYLLYRSACGGRNQKDI